MRLLFGVSLFVSLFLSFCTLSFGQTAITSGGDDVFVSGVGGVTFSVGQFDYVTIESDKGSASLGVQQPIMAKNMPESTEVNDVNGLNCAVFPNPTVGTCVVWIHQDDSVHDYTLSDMIGNILQIGKMKSGDSINLEEYTIGTYFLKVCFDKDKYWVVKILKE